MTIAIPVLLELLDGQNERLLPPDGLRYIESEDLDFFPTIKNILYVVDSDIVPLV